MRLSVITFDYTKEETDEHGSTYTRPFVNSVLDLWIFGGVQRGVMSVKDDSRSLENVWNDYKYQKKIDYEYIRDNKLKHGLNMLYKLQDGLRGTLYFNTFNYIVKDMTSGMKYVAPGDLLTDTMRMIYFSINNDRSIKQGNNKLDKYLIKYSRLLDVVNNIDTLCRGGSCAEITASVISRDTDGYNCRGEFLGDNQSNRMNTRNSSLVELRPWFNEAYINTFNSVPNKKLCEMIEILQPV